jgi:ATP-binding cassette subfamily B (MDR/TAP) protein 1
MFNDIELHTLDIAHMRSQLGLVSQEPVLFNCTIGENIVYGMHKDKMPTQQQIEDAAKQANIHEFIISLPKVVNH